jgi:hypothetical protein
MKSGGVPGGASGGGGRSTFAVTWVTPKNQYAFARRGGDEHGRRGGARRANVGLNEVGHGAC